MKAKTSKITHVEKNEITDNLEVIRVSDFSL